jgi:hypothetical protein
MAKVNFDVAVAFAPAAEGTFDAALDAIAGTLSGVSGGTDDGLLLGDPESGIGGSGLTFGTERIRRDKATLAGSFTRPLSDFLRMDVPTFTFAFPFCGNRRTLSGAPADAEFAPLRGIRGLLSGVGMTSLVWGAGVGQSIKFNAGATPFSALVYYFGNRLELQDCRCSSLSILFEPGTIPIATAEIAVGSVKDPANLAAVALAALPTLDYGTQATVSAPVVQSVGHVWQNTKGFSSLELTITPSQEEIPDGNALNGVLRAPSGREVKVDATIYADNADAVYELKQALVASAADLDSLSFQVGAAGVAAGPATAVRVVVPQPELETGAPDKVGNYGVNAVSLFARNTVANEELEIILL